MHEPDVKQLLTTGGTEPVGNATDEFAAFIKSELARWTRVAKEAGIKPD